MSDSKKIKKNYKLLGTENDPVIIAQRLLNLYRQLHIFSAEKKEAYNQMLMEQTPEVKRTLGALPGGIVVQQYLADIEESAGIDVESFEAETPIEEYETSGESNHYVHPTAVTVASDPEMVKGIVDAFKEAIVTSEKNRKEDTKELAQTIVALQSKLTQTLLDKKGTGTINFNGETASIPLDEIINGIYKAQSELIKEMAQAQTQELSQLISGVLKEIQKMSAQTFITALQAVNGSGLDVFKNNLAGGVSMPSMRQNFKERYARNNKFNTEHIQTSAFDNSDLYNDISNITPVDLDGQDEKDSFTNEVDSIEDASILMDNNLSDNEIADVGMIETDNEALVHENDHIKQDSDNALNDNEHIEEIDTESFDDVEYTETDNDVSSEEYEYVDVAEDENSNEYEWEYIEEEDSENYSENEVGYVEENKNDSLGIETEQYEEKDIKTINENVAEDIEKTEVGTFEDDSEDIEKISNEISNEYEWEYVDETGENVSEDGYEYVDATEIENSDEYEWEYVDETGENVSGDGYEYIDATEVENSDEYEWEYVDETEGNASDDGSQIYDEEQYTDPYNPQIDTYQNQLSDSPFAENNENITFNDNSSDDESISLGDDFGLSLDDDSMALSS